jgi:hypothetical protein
MRKNGSWSGDDAFKVTFAQDADRVPFLNPLLSLPVFVTLFMPIELPDILILNDK